MEKDKSLNETVLTAKENIYIRNALIEQYMPFIASTIQAKIGRYVEYGIDEELSIGLLAFNEAIDKYDIEKGSFLSLAKIVIGRRLIDYQRKNNKVKEMVLYNDDTNNEMEIVNKKSIDLFNVNSENELRRLEINEFKEELFTWGLDFAKLVKHSPKHKRTRRLYKKIVSEIVRDTQLMNYIHNNKRLPIKTIEDKMKVHRKKIERGRIYIIALIIIEIGDYKYLKEYL
ncbi:RNA polymerase sigma factor SigI [Vallitalea longa]|uniref:RNA polymerase sigma factor SigI n=1 Tax=Vallitalea longa TaxID=2936439 RepID=A0A9W6DH54_9FIRM|nr:RNA polymerase sigma-I factor [Vallitalea longa]GKX31217.1 RNA polymerase sigma factor SigI [Vallitalea longa]